MYQKPRNTAHLDLPLSSLSAGGGTRSVNTNNKYKNQGEDDDQKLMRSTPYDEMPLQQIDRDEPFNEKARKSMQSGKRQIDAAGAQQDPNEFSGILSSPGLCGNNSLLQR